MTQEGEKQQTLKSEDNSEPHGVNCYSDGEGKFMEWSQSLRATLFNPLLKVLSKLGFTATHISILSLITGLAFCPCFILVNQAFAFVLLFIHSLLDGLDGPLARYRGTASNRGSFTDTMVDQIVVTITAITMIYTQHAGIWEGSLYIFFYAVVVVFAFVRNALDVPYSWLIRPRFIIYIWYIIEIYWWEGSLNWALSIAAGILAIKSLTGFFSIRKRI